MDLETKLRIVGRIRTYDENGTHFSELYAADELTELERDGLIIIHRPMTEGPYAHRLWIVEVPESVMEWFNAACGTVAHGG